MLGNERLLYYASPVGVLGIADDGKGISRIFISNGKTPEDTHGKSDLIKLAASELDEYFSGKRKVFDVPISLKGTPFQVKIWHELLNIPYGETRSYGEIAAGIDSPRACRAVGMANNKNPIIIIVPCHRVIGKNGDLTGYAGGLAVKEFLLKLEKEK